MNDLLSIIGDHIILDQFETWPKEIIRIIIENETPIKNYLEFKENTDRKAETDDMLRYNRPRNPYESDWNTITNTIDEILKDKMFVGFHCSKLLATEIDNLKDDGLEPLNKDFLLSRLCYAHESQLLCDATYEYLRENNLSSLEGRKGLLFFVLCKSTLKENYGFYKILKYWGGEAVFFHNDNALIHEELSSFGIPTIVLGSLVYDDIIQYKPLSEKMITMYLNRFDDNLAKYDTDNYVCRTVEVIETLTPKDALFEALTNYSNWLYN